jgi:hypothetical protein
VLLSHARNCTQAESTLELQCHLSMNTFLNFNLRMLPLQCFSKAWSIHVVFLRCLNAPHTGLHGHCKRSMDPLSQMADSLVGGWSLAVREGFLGGGITAIIHFGVDRNIFSQLGRPPLNENQHHMHHIYMFSVTQDGASCGVAVGPICGGCCKGTVALWSGQATSACWGECVCLRAQANQPCSEGTLRWPQTSGCSAWSKGALKNFLSPLPKSDPYPEHLGIRCNSRQVTFCWPAYGA